ncbi:MAG: glycosyltransferase family 2 protein [Clostridia bacterium]|nr:glycosyltransferase family 2 protein [Clostridia bacterium]
MSTPKVSIVVPVYNVEKYLSVCIDSIINQTLKDIEIILVDDESTDSSGKICDEYAKKDSRITVIHQKNKWLGGARNSGIKIAKGEYITWVDADDYIKDDYCEKLYRFAVENRCDFVLPSVYNVSENGEMLSKTTKKDAFCNITEKQRLYKLLISSYNYNICRAFISSDIRNRGFLFDEDIRYAEDYEAALRIYKLCERIYCFDEPLYFYRQNDASIMHVIKFERLKQLIYLFELREKFIEENNLKTKENLFNSAHLLIKLLIEKFPFVFGIKGKKYSIKRKEILQTIKDPNIQIALKRISVKKLNMGAFGKLCLIGLKLKLPFLIILLSKKYAKNN